ncbi:aminotransferase class V-fold PLP-dependent enzyme, partial [Paracoccus sp. APAP_BH8]|uniref:aminotransferase class V-fold PLP-dependent enzyme n=1 Tax=Paracoccus sp. APAP_BH8 TaxID=3110237 RepID=UPI002FD83696
MAALGWLVMLVNWLSFGIIARFLNAPREDEVIFTSGATEGINLVSYGWAAPRLEAGDEIVLS